MPGKDFITTADYRNEFDRNKLRFTGIGPRLHNDNPIRRSIWPRDALNVEQECRKILARDIENGIRDNVIRERIASVIKNTVDGFRQVNVNSLFEKHCKLEPRFFQRDPFETNHVLEAYTTYQKVIVFVNQVICAALAISKKKSKNKTTANSQVYLFGCHHNKKLFRRHLNWLVRGNVRLRKITIGHFVYFGEDSCMDLSTVTWLAGTEELTKYRIFIQVIFFITKFVLELLRRYFYITASNHHIFTLFYYRYDLWQKLQARTISQMVDRGILTQFRITDSQDITLAGCSKLKFYLKRDSLRPICTSFRNGRRERDVRTRAVLDFVAAQIGNLEKFSTNNLLAGLKNYRDKLRNGEIEQLYFVRADVKDCFQSVNQKLLRDIVMESLETIQKNGFIRFNKFICTLKKKIRNKMSTFEMLTLADIESVRASNRYADVQKKEGDEEELMSLQEFKDEYLSLYIMNPIIRESRQSKFGYRLNVGLRQGAMFSPILSNIYIQKAFAKHFQDQLRSEDCRVFCYVDDILFISSCLEKSQRFMKKMLEGFRDFNLRMNLGKLACNFPCPSLEKVDANICELGDHLVFYREKICLTTLKCSHDYSCESLELQYTFAASPYVKHVDTIRRSIQSNRFDYIHLDCKLNGLKLVLENIFEKLVLIAHRTATSILINFNFKRNDRQKEVFITKLVTESAKRAHRIVKLGNKRKMIENDLKYHEILLLAAAAYKVTWNSFKMSHRLEERDRIDRFYKRVRMSYLVVLPKGGIRVINKCEFSRRDRICEMIEQLASGFKNSPLYPHMRLPGSQIE